MTSGISTGVHLTRLLQAYGVDTVFGIPGVHTVELYRGLAGSGIRHVTPRHEQGAGFMADGYARASGRPGVCFIITGPGMTNIATAMAQAHADSVPMLVISTVNAHGRMGSGDGWLHELPNQQATISGVAAFSRTVHRPEELAPALAQAFAVFGSARPRPVHIELPIDVMLAEAGHLPIPRPTRLSRPAPDAEAVAGAAALLAGAQRPVILAGGGAARSDAGRLAERLDAPLVMTTNARGLLPPDHPLAVSLSPSLPATRAMIAAADVVLAIGTEFGSTDYDMYEDDGFTLPGRLIRIDIDPLQIGRRHPAEIGIVSDAALAVQALIAALPLQTGSAGTGRAESARAGMAALEPAMRGDLLILNLIRDTLPDARIVGDSTQLTYAGNLAFAAARPGSWFNSATGFGTLGYGLPAAIGARLADDRPTVAISGDGGLQFSLGELASAAEAQVPLILLVHDNQGYGEIKSFMLSKNIPPLGVDILTPDIAAIAAACGWQFARLTDLDALPDLLQRGAAAYGPTLIIFGDDLRAQAQSRIQAQCEKIA